jgi:hypothetical protein
VTTGRGLAVHFLVRRREPSIHCGLSWMEPWTIEFDPQWPRDRAKFDPDDLMRVLVTARPDATSAGSSHCKPDARANSLSLDEVEGARANRAPKFPYK